LKTITKNEEMLELGGTGILLQGGLHPDLRIEYYENLLRARSNSVSRKSICTVFSAPEIGCMRSLRPQRARNDRAMMAAGLDSIPGGGAKFG